ncbi:hypothetical protein ACVSQB_38550 [Bradyrhizobium elkanii]
MKSPLDPDVDEAPSALAVHDEQHMTTYLRLFDAQAQGRAGRKSQKSRCISIRNANWTMETHLA